MAEIELAEYDSPELVDIADKLADENFDPPVLDDAPPVLEEAPNAELPAAAYLPFVSSVENASGAAAESASDTDSATAAEGMVQAASAPLATAHKVKYYFFNGQRIAMERDGTFTYLHGDHLGSTIAETNTTGARTAWREYKPYGTRRRGSTQLNTDRTYTGQQSEETGLMYYNARYYDPQIGHFISPDTIVPDPGNVLDYNRYLYVRGRVLNYNDPTGHCGVSAVAGPAGVVIDIPCWTSTAPAAAAGAATVVGAAGAVFAVGYVLSEPALDYPAPFPETEIGEMSASFPLPDSNTLSIDGIPLVTEETYQLVTPDTGTEITSDNSGTTLTPSQAGDNIVFSSRLLDRNMKSAGRARPPSSSAHHIVAQNDPRAATARAILIAAGVGMNDADNGVYLPANSSVVNTGSAIHSKVHTNKYYRNVNNRLLNPGAGGVVGELQRIGNELANGTFSY